jgi:hypothetical protein
VQEAQRPGLEIVGQRLEQRRARSGPRGGLGGSFGLWWWVCRGKRMDESETKSSITQLIRTAAGSGGGGGVRGPKGHILRVIGGQQVAAPRQVVERRRLRLGRQAGGAVGRA